MNLKSDRKLHDYSKVVFNESQPKADSTLLFTICYFDIHCEVVRWRAQIAPEPNSVLNIPYVTTIYHLKDVLSQLYYI